MQSGRVSGHLYYQYFYIRTYLSIGHSQRSWVISSVVPFCPSLTHLCIMNQTIDRSVVQALSKAVQDGRLPSLSHLSLINCRRTPYRNSSNPPLGLSAIFKSTWPQIQYLNLCGTLLGRKDIAKLSETSRVNLLPSLQALFLTVNSILHPNESLQLLWVNPLNSLTTFCLDDSDLETFLQFTKAIARNMFPNLVNLAISQRKANPGIDLELISFESLKFLRYLTLHRYILQGLKSLICNRHRNKLRSLDISYCLGVSQSLASLLGYQFLSLSSLILSHCGLCCEDLHSLAQANLENTLPCLLYLDISENFVELKWLFHNNCTWNNLRGLNVARVYYKAKYEDNLSKIIPDGCLPSLEEFSFSKEYYKKLGVKLMKLKLLQVHIYQAKSLKNISLEVEKSLLPALCMVCINFTQGETGFARLDLLPQLHKIEGIRRLQKMNITCHLAVTPDIPFTAATCVFLVCL